METFRDIKQGDIVTYKRYAGMGPQGPEYKVARAKVNPLLIFATHVVVNSGAFGQVVNEDNFISTRGGK